MTDEITQFDYQHAIIADDGSETARIVGAFFDVGVDLLAFSAFLAGVGKLQLDFIARDPDMLETVARKLALRLSGRKSGFLITGQNQPVAVADALSRLAKQGIPVTSVQSITAGAGRYGALVWVKPEDVSAASKTLGSTTSHDAVDEASEESFPASDAPAGSISRIA